MTIYTSADPLIPVEKPNIGTKYHLSWARKTGMVWILKGIEGDKAILQTPKTKKRLEAKLVDLRHIRANQERIEKGKQPL